MMIVFDEKALTNLQEFVLSLGIDTVAVQQSGNHYLEITHAAAKKSAGIDYIMQKEALSEGETAVLAMGTMICQCLNGRVFQLQWQMLAQM